MSMSFGGINDYGFILSSEEFKEILTLVDKKILELDEEDELDDLEDYDLQEISNLVGFEEWYVSQANFARLVEINLETGFPRFDNNGIKTDYFDDENIFIMSFNKDSLVKKYDNFDEIVKEIKESLAKILQISIETIEKKLGENFIKNHIGIINGYYCC